MTITQAAWSAIPAVIQYGTVPTTIDIYNLGKNETLDLKVTSPNGESFKLTVVATELGAVSKELHLVSGEGIYIIELWKETCTPNQLCYTLVPLTIIAQKCKVEDIVNNLQLFCNNSYMAAGLYVDLTVVGTPDTPFTISQSASGMVDVQSGTTDKDGIGNIKAEVMGLSSTFIAIQGKKISNSVITQTPADINSPATSVDTGSELVFSTLKTSLAIAQDIVFPLTIQIQNTFEETVRVSIAKTSGTLQPDVPVYMQYEPIASGSTREFTFFMVGHHSNQTSESMNVAFSGSYSKLDGTVIPWSYSSSVLVPPRKLHSGIMITSLVSEPATIQLGESAKIHLEISNIGETDISDMNLQALHFPDTVGQLNFTNVPLPKGQTYTTTAIIKPTKIDTYLFTVEGALISGKAQGQVVLGENELTTSLLVLKK